MADALLYCPAINVLVGIANAPAGAGPVEPPDTFQGTFALSSPPDGATVATATPPFAVGVVPSDPNDDSDYSVEVAYDDNTAFSAPTVLTTSFNALDGGAYFSPTGPVPATTYWRARLFDADGDQIHTWIGPHSFTVLTTVTPSTATCTWTVSGSANRLIHLWHVDPPGPDVGDTVTVYGQGFPSTGHLSFGDLPVDVASWTLVAADADMLDDTQRVIDGDNVSPEHYEVTFVAPDYEGPGAPLQVEV